MLTSWFFLVNLFINFLCSSMHLTTDYAEFFFKFSAQRLVPGTNLSMFFCTLPSLVSSDMNIRYRCSSSSLEFYNEVFLLAASLLFFLQGCLSEVYHHASHDQSILLATCQLFKTH